MKNEEKPQAALTVLNGDRETPHLEQPAQEEPDAAPEELEHTAPAPDAPQDAPQAVSAPRTPPKPPAMPPAPTKRAKGWTYFGQ